MTLEMWIEDNNFQDLFNKFKLAARRTGILDPNDQYTFARECMIALRYELEQEGKRGFPYAD